MYIVNYVIELRVVQFRGNRVVISNRPCATRSANLNLLARLLPELYSTQSDYYYLKSLEEKFVKGHCPYEIARLCLLNFITQLNKKILQSKTEAVVW